MTYHPVFYSLADTVTSAYKAEKNHTATNAALSHSVTLRAHSLSSAEIKDPGTAPGHWFFPEARALSAPISARSVLRQSAFPWNYPIG